MMTWFEAVLGISPDGGNGTAEVAVAFGIALAFAAALGRRYLVRAWHAKIKPS